MMTTFVAQVGRCSCTTCDFCALGSSGRLHGGHECIGWVSVMLSLLWGYFKKAGLGQETSREAKHFVTELMIQNSGDEQFRYEDSKI